MEECIDAVEEAFGLWGRGEVPDPAVLGVHVSGGGFHVKAATLGQARPYFGAKTNANFPLNPERLGLPAIQGVIALFDIECGIPLAVIDSIRITELRTAAATAVAVSHLSRPESTVATLIGCGVQARSHLRALMVVRGLERVWVSDADPARAQRSAGEMTAELAIPIEVANDLREATLKSDICVTCTPSREPVIGLGDVAPGATVAAVEAATISACAPPTAGARDAGVPIRCVGSPDRLPEDRIEPVPKTKESTSRSLENRNAFSRYAEQATRMATAIRRGLLGTPAHQPLGLHAVQGLVEGASRDPSASLFVQLS